MDNENVVYARLSCESPVLDVNAISYYWDIVTAAASSTPLIELTF